MRNNIKPFTAILFVHQPFTTKSYRTFLENKFFSNHPNCYYYDINPHQIIAYYTDPIYVAILLQKSKEYYCTLCLLEDRKSRKLNPRTITIRKNPKIIEIQELLHESKAQYITETISTVIIKLPNFLKTTQLLRKLTRMKILATFTPKNLLKEQSFNY